MSPSGVAMTATKGCFPRVSGDEPTVMAYRSRGTLFSPRERG